MIKSCFSFADISISIFHRFEEIDRFCADYITDQKGEIQIVLNADDIQYEKENSIKQFGEKKAQLFSDGYYEYIAAQRKISEIFPLFDRALIHGSALSFDGNGILFAANSGVGKSTHAELWRNVFKDRVIMVNDDKPFIRTGEKIVVYGSPWNGKHHLSNNICCELKTICFLERSKCNKAVRVDPSEAFLYLLRHIYRPENSDALERTFNIIDDIVKKVNIYHLSCNKSTNAVYAVYNKILEVSDETKS